MSTAVVSGGRLGRSWTRVRKKTSRCGEEGDGLGEEEEFDINTLGGPCTLVLRAVSLVTWVVMVGMALGAL